MVPSRSRRLAAGLFICSVVLASCKKEDAGSGASGGAGGAASQDLTLIPVDSELVVGLNFAQGLSSAMFRDTAMPQLTRNAKVSELLEKIKAKCGFDPIAALTSATVGVRNLGGVADGVMVIRGLEKGKVLPCVDQLKGEIDAQKAEVTRDGDVVLIKGSGADDTAAISFTEEKAALVVFGPKGTKAGVAEVAQGKSGVSSSKEFLDMYGRVKTGDTLWLLLNGGAEPVAKQLEKLNVKSKAVFGSVNVTDGLTADLRMRVESEDQATNVAKLIESQVEPFSQFADKLEIKNDKTDVRFSVSFSPEKLKSLAQFAGGFLRRR